MIVQPRIESDGTVVLTVMVDSLISVDSPAFKMEADPVILASTGRVEVDCSRLEFIDSSGMAALLHANKLLPAERSPVRLTGVGKKVLTILEMMCVHRSFDLQLRN